MIDRHASRDDERRWPLQLGAVLADPTISPTIRAWCEAELEHLDPFGRQCAEMEEAFRRLMHAHGDAPLTLKALQS